MGLSETPNSENHTRYILAVTTETRIGPRQQPRGLVLRERGRREDGWDLNFLAAPGSLGDAMVSGLSLANQGQRGRKKRLEKPSPDR